MSAGKAYPFMDAATGAPRLWPTMKLLVEKLMVERHGAIEVEAIAGAAVRLARERGERHRSRRLPPNVIPFPGRD
jgi:hypothetical protein